MFNISIKKTMFSELDPRLFTAWIKSSYWGEDLSEAEIISSFKHSSLLVFAYKHDTPIGCLRVITDTTRCAYISDVWVEAPYRYKGIGKRMIGFAINDCGLADVRQWLLSTRDQQQLYSVFGFTRPASDTSIMIKKKI